MTYKGHTIIYKCGVYFALGVVFKTIAAAKKKIDTIYA